MLRFLLFPFSFLYGLVVYLRNRLFDAGIIKSYKSQTKTIVVGNLAVGGSGKSPMVEYLIRLLQKDFKVAVLSRGYGRQTKGYVLASQSSSVSEIGDEPKQIVSKFNHILVAVCEDRTTGIKQLESENCDVIILDDAFQHRKITGGLNLILTAFQKPFYNDFMMPMGSLRDNKKEKRRAQAFIVTKSPKNLSESEAAIISTKLNPSAQQKIFFSGITYAPPTNISSGSISGKKNIILVTAIANTDVLLADLKKEHNILNHVKYRDHHDFDKNDLLKIRNLMTKFVKEDPIVLTTEKDYVKIKPLLQGEYKSLPVFFIPIKSEFIFKRNEFDEMIINYLRNE